MIATATAAADEVDVVVGVDTHKATHTAAVVTVTGAVVDRLAVSADPGGYRALLALAHQHPGRRVWAAEGTGGYGAGLCAPLVDRGERVVEVKRPTRPARTAGAKSDAIDAVRAARDALARTHEASPRAPGAAVPAWQRPAGCVPDGSTGCGTLWKIEIRARRDAASERTQRDPWN